MERENQLLKKARNLNTKYMKPNDIINFDKNKNADTQTETYQHFFSMIYNNDKGLDLSKQFLQPHLVITQK